MLANPAIDTDTITYEQPVGESMQIYLRLEHLFNQLTRSLDDSNAAMSALVKILEVINRPDLKSKLTQILTQYATTLAQLEQFPQVDTNRLNSILSQLDGLISSLNRQQNRIGERLRNNEFLNQIRLQQANPGGSCAYNTPAYALWLRKPLQTRIKDLEHWLSEFSELREIVNLILYLIRNSGPAKTVIAEKGFYHQNLDPTLPCGIIRATLPTLYCVFPEFSVGRHRLSIRFLIPSYHNHGRAQQHTETIEFELSCCRI